MSDQVTQEPHGIKLSKPVVEKLGQVRRMLRKYVCIQTLLSAMCWGLFVFWIGGLFDFLPVRAGSSESPRWLRIVFLVCMFGGCAWIIIGWALPRLLRRIKDRSVALLIEKHYEQFDNRLVTAVELSDGRNLDEEVSNPRAYQNMLERVHGSLDERISQVEVRELFNWQPIWSRGVLTVLAVGLTTFAIFGFPNWMSIWANRLFALSDRPWPRQAQLETDGIQLQLPAFSRQLASERTLIPFENGLVRVPQGSRAVLMISAQAEEKVVPEVCTMFYASEDGERGRANLRRIGAVKDGWQEFALDGPPLDGIASSMEIDVVGLDYSLRDLFIEAVSPVLITDLQIKCTYPKYLLQSVTRPEQEMLPYQTGIRIPQGTEVSLIGKTSRGIGRVDYLLQNRETDESGQLSIADRIVRLEASGTQFEIPIGKLNATEVVEVRVLDEFGLPSERIPRYVLSMLEDSVPEVTAKLVGIGSSITPNALLPIQGTVTDDNGVAGVYVDLLRGENESVIIPTNLEEGDKLDTTIDLKQLAEQGRFAPKIGETIGLVVEARDYYDLSENGHEGQSPPIQLNIVTKDELLVILDRQELGLRQRLEQIILELNELQEIISSLALLEGEPFEDRTRFRAQQCIQQTDKSEQELDSLAKRMDNIRMQLKNNRTDSYDRELRLQSRVIAPLRRVVDLHFAGLSANLQNAAIRSNQRVPPSYSAALSDLSFILDELEKIKSSMLDIESFNEIIDLVRGLLDEQDLLIQETEKAQKAKILDFLQ